MSCDVGKAGEGLEAEPHSPTLTSLHLCHSSFSNTSAPLPTSQLILQPFRCFTYVIGTSPMSQLILQPFRCFVYVIKHFIYVTAHSPTLPPLHLRHNSFYSPSAASPTSQVILQPFLASPTSEAFLQSLHRFTYVTAHSPTVQPLYLRHSSFYSPSVASPTS